MFLPILLMRDYGTWGFVVFAVPNVIGAGAMGWVLARSGSAERLVAGHAGACRAFSSVTIAFHLFFAQWLAVMVGGWGWFLLVAAAPIGAAVLLRRSQRFTRMAAAAVWIVSVAALASVLADRAGADAWSLGAGAPPTDLLWLAPVTIFGFALCPYVDFTFLRARRACDAAGARLAFSLGFGVFFLAMILLTLLYAPLLSSQRLEPAFAGSLTLGLLAAHVCLQLVFTCGVHWKESLTQGGARLLWGPAAGVALGLPFMHGWSVGEMSSYEVVYRGFLSFYGLVFPAYVWICMIPTADGHSGLGGERGRRKLLAWCGVVGLAAPLYWMGFIMLEELYLVPGLLFVLLGRLFVRSSGSTRAGS